MGVSENGGPPKKVLFSETPIMAMNLNLLKQPRSLNPNPAHWKAECRALRSFASGPGFRIVQGFLGSIRIHPSLESFGSSMRKVWAIPGGVSTHAFCLKG